MVERVDHDILDRTSFAVIHIVRDVIKVKHVHQEICTHLELREASIGICPGTEQPVFETIDSHRVFFSLRKLDSLEEPTLRFLGHLLMVAVDFDVRWK